MKTSYPTLGANAVLPIHSEVDDLNDADREILHYGYDMVSALANLFLLGGEKYEVPVLEVFRSSITMGAAAIQARETRDAAHILVKAIDRNTEALLWLARSQSQFGASPNAVSDLG